LTGILPIPNIPTLVALRGRHRHPTRTTGVRRVWKFLKYVGVACGILLGLIVLLGAVLYIWRPWEHEEEWYVEVTAPAEPVAREKQVEAGEEFERQALDLRNDARHTGAWEASFTDTQVNGWLANDLNEKFPGRLPTTIQDPRVKFVADNAKIAFRVKTTKMDAVIIVGVDVYLTDKPNELALRLRDAHAGLLPLPKKQVVDTVTKAAAKLNVPVVWSQNDGDPVALLQIPEQIEQIDGRLTLETVEVRDGEIHFTGRTLKPDGSSGTTNVQGVILSHLFLNRNIQR